MEETAEAMEKFFGGFEKDNHFDDWFSPAANPENQLTTEPLGGLGPVSSTAPPSVIASSDLFGAGQYPFFSNLEEVNLRDVESRDPQEAVKQFLEFQHIDPNIAQDTWPSEIHSSAYPEIMSLDKRWPLPTPLHKPLIPPPLHARK